MVNAEAPSSFAVNFTEAGSFGFSDVVRSLAGEDVSLGLMVVAAFTSVWILEKALSSFSK